MICLLESSRRNELTLGWRQKNSLGGDGLYVYLSFLKFWVTIHFVNFLKELVSWCLFLCGQFSSEGKSFYFPIMLYKKKFYNSLVLGPHLIQISFRYIIYEVLVIHRIWMDTVDLCFMDLLRLIWSIPYVLTLIWYILAVECIANFFCLQLGQS